MNLGRVVSAVVGALLILCATALTAWAAVAGKAVSAVGVGGMYVVGVLLALAGMLDLRPSSLAFGKDGVTLQLVADAVKNVKDAAQQMATQVAADPDVRQAVVGAKTDDAAGKVAESISQRIVQGLPATADLTRKALNSMTSGPK